jgi:hypothetical protein
MNDLIFFSSKMAVSAMRGVCVFSYEYQELIIIDTKNTILLVFMIDEKMIVTSSN